MNAQSNDQPWKEKGISKNTRLMARVGLYLISFTAFFWLIGSVYLIISPSPKTGNFWSDTFPYIILFVILGGLILFSVKLFHLSRAPISFTPSYDKIDPTKPGEPFEVWYQQSLIAGRAISFRSTLTFRPEGLISPVLDNLRRQVAGTIPYANISGVSVKGRYIKFEIMYDVEKVRPVLKSLYKPQIAFYVSEADGERMYRELKKYFPSAVAQYIV